MPTKRQFDMVLITVVLASVALKLAKAAAPRWRTQFNNALGKATGKAVSA